MISNKKIMGKVNPQAIPNIICVYFGSKLPIHHQSAIICVTESRESFIMGAPIGNKFWEIRAKHGRERLLTDPDALREDCIGYFEWVEDNPLQEEKIFSFQGSCNVGTIEKMRAMTVEGLCLHLGIGYSTWRDYANRDDCKDISEVITWAESVMRNQKFTGAAADLLNPNIIARDLGLADRQQIQHKVTDDGSNEW